jgi:all-trans-retinol 13,14-reductase
MFIVFGTIDNGEMREKLTWTNRYCIPPGLDILAVDQACPETGTIMLTAPGNRDSNPIATNSPTGVILMRPAAWSETKAFDTGKDSNRTAAYQEWKTTATERLLDRAEQLWGPSARITPIASGTPLTFRDALDAPEGAVYGVAHSMDQFLTGTRTRVPGLWLSGQSTLMTGVVGSSLAGMITAGEILGLEQTWDEVRQCR